MKKVKYITLILVLALGLLGGAYAAWHDALQAKGTVSTGTIDVQFTQAESNDPGEALDPSCPEGDEKHVGSTAVEIIDEGKKLLVTIENAYPGYESEVYYCVVNYGTVPVKLQSKNVTIKGNAAGLEVENGIIEDLWQKIWQFLFGSQNQNNEDPPVPEQLILEVGSQLHQNVEHYGAIKHTVTEDAKQGKTYQYTIGYDFVQFNMYNQP